MKNEKNSEEQIDKIFANDTANRLNHYEIYPKRAIARRQ